MDVTVRRRFESRLPAGDDHPYRTGAWRPSTVEYDALDLDVVEGAIPRDLAGVYLRNTENPLLPSLGRYHPFDGDGMLHALHVHDGRADYRNRFVRTAGLAAELEAGEPLWAGIIEPPALSRRDGGCARTRMKDASSTDVIVHAGVALSTFYQCGLAYRLDPVTLEDRGTAPWGAISAHPKVDVHTGELLYFRYGTEAPYLWYGLVDAAGALVHEQPVPLPGPRLPHDMAFTERFAILNDLPQYWDPAQLARGVYRPRFDRDQPSRFALVPRAGGEPRWFDAAPTYVLHFVNAFEDGDEVVLDGFHQSAPSPSLDTHALGTRLHRWRFDLRTGATRESVLDDRVTEFPTLDARVAGRRHRYAYAMTTEPGWFLFNGIVKYDLERGTREDFAFPAGTFASESPFAPREGAIGEDDGYLLTFTTDAGADRSECWIFAAQDLAAGPVARLALPARIASGTHACWSPASR